MRSIRSSDCSAVRYRLHYWYAAVAVYDTHQDTYVWSTACPHEERAFWLQQGQNTIDDWLRIPTCNPHPDPRMNNQPIPRPMYVPAPGDTGTATIRNKDHPKGIDREARILEVHGPVLVITHRDPRPGDKHGHRWVPRATIPSTDFQPTRVLSED